MHKWVLALLNPVNERLSTIPISRVEGLLLGLDLYNINLKGCQYSGKWKINFKHVRSPDVLELSR